ncbi:MAG: hypothetical protein J7K98_00090 [Candidatus Aenigmarchaeota archaeon]|nr:hypothetical protein [Candidatus Aenigmarchaeota archaeon]
MSKHGWDDYWKKFKGEGKRLSLNLKLEVNRWVLISLLIIVGVIAISYIGMETGKYIKVLEQNTTLLLQNLTKCEKEVQNLQDSLSSCNSNLESKTLALQNCKNEKKTLQTSLNDCKDDLDEWKDKYSSLEDDYEECQVDLDDYKEKYSDCKDDLNDCKDDLDDYKSKYNTCTDDFNDLKTKFAECYCCEHNNASGTYYYKIDGNNILCSATNATGYSEVNCTAITCSSF